MSGLFSELKRRNVFRVAGAYAVVGWILAQIATTLEESLGLPAWFDASIVALLLLGLPIALIICLGLRTDARRRRQDRGCT